MKIEKFEKSTSIVVGKLRAGYTDESKDDTKNNYDIDIEELLTAILIIENLYIEKNGPLVWGEYHENDELCCDISANKSYNWGIAKELFASGSCYIYGVGTDNRYHLSVNNRTEKIRTIDITSIAHFKIS